MLAGRAILRRVAGATEVKVMVEAFACSYRTELSAGHFLIRTTREAWGWCATSRSLASHLMKLFPRLLL